MTYTDKLTNFSPVQVDYFVKNGNFLSRKGVIFAAGFSI